MMVITETYYYLDGKCKYYIFIEFFVYLLSETHGNLWHKNATSYTEQILEATPHRTAVERPPISHP